MAQIVYPVSLVAAFFMMLVHWKVWTTGANRCRCCPTWLRTLVRTRLTRTLLGPGSYGVDSYVPDYLTGEHPNDNGCDNAGLATDPKTFEHLAADPKFFELLHACMLLKCCMVAGCHRGGFGPPHCIVGWVMHPI